MEPFGRVTATQKPQILTPILAWVVCGLIAGLFELDLGPTAIRSLRSAAAISTQTAPARSTSARRRSISA